MKNKKKRLIIVNALVLGVTAILMVVGLLTIVNSANQKDQAGDTFSRIKAQKQIIIGLDDTFVPMGFRDKNGKLAGFDIDLATKVFDQYGIQIKWQPIDWSMKETELNSGNIDAIWNGYTINDARKKLVNFSTPYKESSQIIVTRSADHLQKMADLKDKILAVQTGSSGEELFNESGDKLKNRVKNQSAVGYDTYDKAFDDLNAKRIDALVIDEVYADYFISHQDNPGAYFELKGEFPEDQFGVGVRKSDKTLLNKINQALATLKKDGTLQKINEKWFGTEK